MEIEMNKLRYILSYTLETLETLETKSADSTDGLFMRIPAL
jgi:hypothetical protein